MTIFFIQHCKIDKNVSCYFFCSSDLLLRSTDQSVSKVFNPWTVIIEKSRTYICIIRMYVCMYNIYVLYVCMYLCMYVCMYVYTRIYVCIVTALTSVAQFRRAFTAILSYTIGLRATSKETRQKSVFTRPLLRTTLNLETVVRHQARVSVPLFLKITRYFLYMIF